LLGRFDDRLDPTGSLKARLNQFGHGAARRDTARANAKHDDYGPVESWNEEVDEHAIEFVTFKQDIDSTTMLKGLPGH
jgi:hypothetical protein